MVFGFGKKEGAAAPPPAATEEQIDESPVTTVVVPPSPVEQETKEIQMKIEDEVDVDPTRLKLEEEVQERDAMISAIEKARVEKVNELKHVENQLGEEKLAQMKEALIHKIESERIKRQTENAAERLKALETDMQDKAAIHEYANLIKGVAPKGGVDAQYVQKLQSQLQKAVKKMESTTEQMKELESQSTDTIDGLTKDIAVLVEGRCRTELELRKQMDVLLEQKRDMQLNYESRIRENLKTLQALRAKAVNQTTIEELESELEDSEAKLEELKRIHDKQLNTIETLQTALSQEGGL
jgi:DNA repair exonuclease SbcCD ATPase subunit